MKKLIVALAAASLLASSAAQAQEAAVFRPVGGPDYLHLVMPMRIP